MIVERVLKVLIARERPGKNVDDDVSIAYVDEHVVFEIERLLLTNEDSIADTEVPHEIGLTLRVKLYLEIASTMLFRRLVILAWNHKIIDHMFNSC